jgi:hypothetical protein
VAQTTDRPRVQCHNGASVTGRLCAVLDKLPNYELDWLREAADCEQLARDVRDRARKYELECLRQASDCMQLARDVQNRALVFHFLQMAKVWTSRAEQGPESSLGPVIH